MLHEVRILAFAEFLYFYLVHFSLGQRRFFEGGIPCWGFLRAVLCLSQFLRAFFFEVKEVQGKLLFFYSLQKLLSHDLQFLAHFNQINSLTVTHPRSFSQLALQHHLKTGLVLALDILKR